MKRRSFLALPWLRVNQPLDAARIDRSRILKAARQYLGEAPETITTSHSPRSSGGVHDYFSEGDYWWPDPKNPGGPYIQRDGMSNPDNFAAHRRALMRFSVQAPALAAAWRITREERYAVHAARHVRAWFLDPKTRMNPSLEYAQAIHGVATGRGIGIIDTIHLVEVARAVPVLAESRALSEKETAGVRNWFADYLRWMCTHPYGHAERDAKNNHGTCWAMQASAFAWLTANEQVTAFCRERYKTVLLPGQMAADGSFPLELKRTKPYSYSLFNLDAMTMVCQILDLWTFALPDGRSMGKGVEFLAPYIADKSKWSYPPDVMYFDQWPVRQPSLLFAGLALGRKDYLDLWRRLNPDPTTEEIIRNYPIRQPVLWL